MWVQVPAVKIYTLDSDEVQEIPSTRRNLWLAAAPTTNSFAVQNDLKSVIISDPKPGDQHRQLDLDFLPVCGNWLPSSDALVLASRFGYGAKIVTTENPPRTFARGDASLSAEVMSLTSGANLVAAGLLSGEVLLWRSDSPTRDGSVQPLSVWQLSKSPIYSCAIQGSWLVAASHDGELIRALIPP